MQATKIIHIRSLSVFQGEAAASAKALRQHMIAVFQEYQGSQCGRGRVHKEENKEEEGQQYGMEVLQDLCISVHTQ